MHVSHDAEACSSSAGFTPVEGIEVLVPARLHSSTADVEARDPGGVTKTYACLAAAIAMLALSCTSRPATLDPDEPAAGVASAAYAFRRIDPVTKEPVRFDPCEPIHYVVNPDGAPPMAAESIAEVLAEAGRLTGLTFLFDGETDERPVVRPPKRRSEGVLVQRDYGAGRFPGRWPPVLFFWVKDPLAELGQDIGGAGGPDRAVVNGKERYVSGVVVLNPQATRRSTNLRLGLKHEVAHLLGLDHVVNPAQIMNFEHALFDRPGYGAGDREGFRQLGREKGCLERAEPGSEPVQPGAPPNAPGHSAPGHRH